MTHYSFGNFIFYIKHIHPYAAIYTNKQFALPKGDYETRVVAVRVKSKKK